jgi:hypothetical protein
MRIFTALWKWPDEEMEFSLHQTETGAINSLAEEIESFTDDESFCFNASEYERLMEGSYINYEDPDQGTLWVHLVISEVMQ